MNPVVHFEMPYGDAERVAEFYKDAFGWTLVNTGETMGNYITAQTAETDENNMVKTPGTINGGFYPKGDSQYPEPSVVISVNDIQAAMRNITEAGGEVLGDPMEISGIGMYVSFRDSEGNRASILEPNR